MVPAFVTEDTVLSIVAAGHCPMVAFEIAQHLHRVEGPIEQPDLNVIATTARQVPEIVRLLHRHGLLTATPDGMAVLSVTPAGLAAAQRLAPA